jgi:hypothetical protein
MVFGHERQLRYYEGSGCTLATEPLLRWLAEANEPEPVSMRQNRWQPSGPF